MLPTDRLVLIDLENVVGARPKPRTLRARVTALLDAAGPRHHAVAAYAVSDFDDDPMASTLACLGVAPLRVAPGPDAAEAALLAHARRMRAEGCVLFTVCSSDHEFAALASAEDVRVEVLIWAGQPCSARLEQVVHQVTRLPRPTGAAARSSAGHPPLAVDRSGPDPVSGQDDSRCLSSAGLLSSLATGIVTGLGIALGHRIADTLHQRRHRDHQQ